MTTAAYDGRYLAADTLAHREGVPSNMECRKIDICEGFAYAICGAYAAMLGSIIAWHRAGAKPDDFPQHGDGGVMIIEIATRRVWVVIKGVPYLDEEAAPLCAGSGRDVALGALWCGMTAMEAVKIAARCDTHTNDTIDFIDLEFPVSGVQRWDGMMPSKVYPMPLQTEWLDQLTRPDGVALRSVVHPDSIETVEVEIPGCEDQCPGLERGHGHEWRKVKSFPQALKCSVCGLFKREDTSGQQDVTQWIDEAASTGMAVVQTDEEGNQRLVARPEYLSSYVGDGDPSYRKTLDRESVQVHQYAKVCECAYCRKRRGDVSSIVSKEQAQELVDTGTIKAREPNPAHHLDPHGGVIGRADICDHGYVRRTCDTCSGVERAVNEVRHAQKANGKG